MNETLDGSVLVAISILTLIAGISITAIIRYPKVKDALKIISVLSSLMGVVTGAFVTYFFTKPQIVSAQENFATAQAENLILQNRIADLSGSLEVYENVVIETPNDEEKEVLLPAEYKMVNKKLWKRVEEKVCEMQEDGTCNYRSITKLVPIPTGE